MAYDYETISTARVGFSYKGMILYGFCGELCKDDWLYRMLSKESPKEIHSFGISDSEGIFDCCAECFIPDVNPTTALFVLR